MDAARCTVTASAVLFDLDGVLVDSTAAVEGHWRDFAARHDLDATALLADLHGRRMVDIIARALPNVDSAQLADEARMVETAEATGARDGTQPQPGALDLVRALAGQPWAIVTSGTSPVALARMEAVGLPRPAVFVPGEEVPLGKPDPGPYLLAAERLGVRPRDCVVIEDAPAGLAAGRAAGSTTVAVATSHDVAALHVADHVVRTPAEIELLQGDGITLSLTCQLHAPVVSGSRT
jgi:sugar-phosphatase